MWKCKACKVRIYLKELSFAIKLSVIQRESTATIRAPANAYQQASPPKRQNIVEFDCRGLEFVEFKADV